MRLAHARVGTAVVVRGVDAGEAGQGRRLQDVGLLAGTIVLVERRAPFGDPTVYMVRGSRLAIRRADALLVEVEPARAGDDGGAASGDGARAGEAGGRGTLR